MTSTINKLTDVLNSQQIEISEDVVFGRRNIIGRSPPKSAPAAERVARIAQRTGSKTQESLPNMRESLISLGERVKELTTMMSEQRHVNTAMRDLAAGIADLQTTVVKFWESSTRVKPSNEGKTLKGNPHMVERASQTSPEREADKRGSVYKRVREESHKSRRFSPKRHKGPPQIRVPHKLMLPDPGQGDATAGGESTPTTAPVTRVDTPSSKLQKWQLVDSK
ncbi:GL13220 [Drosophila persimilis]|uniref:GL13220 n=1 Tax=Drosophila persimilis TaxID=7234 RepID=B4HCM6_DROPE|nr:GL13220 [Drosophila persimilis]